MQSLLFALFVTIALDGWAPMDAGRPVDWETLSLEGKSLELIDDTRVETYHFGAEGLAAATSGNKDGPLTGPVLYWRVDDQSLIISKSQNAQVLEELRILRVQADIVSVMRKTGAKAEFRIIATGQF